MHNRKIGTEASFEGAPSLLDEALQLDVETCDIPYWIEHVAQGTWRGLAHGHRATTPIPAHMFQEGPMRTAMLKELAFRAISEERGTRAITHVVRTAPTPELMDFFSTQVIDEARHGAAFRGHLRELGIAREELPSKMDELAGAGVRDVLMPLERFVMEEMQGDRDFVIGVLMLTLVVEGVLAPASEMSERKWKVIDPAAAEIARSANIDELRHLAVGAAVVRNHLQAQPEDRERILAAAKKGLEFWQKAPIGFVIMEREALFQQGLDGLREQIGDYELVPGRRLVDTTVQERLMMQMEWSRRLQTERLAFMGLS